MRRFSVLWRKFFSVLKMSVLFKFNVSFEQIIVVMSRVIPHAAVLVMLLDFSNNNVINNKNKQFCRIRGLF